MIKIQPYLLAFIFSCCFFVMSSWHIYAQQDTILTKEKVLMMSYDDLLELNFEEVKILAKIVGVSVDELFDIIISTAGKKKEKARDIPASVIVITRSEIETYGYSSLTEILENIPGLYGINNLYAFGSSFGIRGFWSENTNSNIIFMVNGINQTFDYFGSSPMNKIIVPVEAIERIEVVRGPMSVMYGSGAFFGAINIITSLSDETDNEKNNIVSASYGSNDSKKGFLRLSGSNGNIKYAFNSSVFKTDGYDYSFDKMTDYSLGDETPPSTKGLLDDNQKYFSFTASFNDFSVVLDYSESHKKGFMFYPPLTDGNNSEMKTFNTKLLYNKALGQKFRFKTKLIYSNNSFIDYHDKFIANYYGYDDYENNAIQFELNTFYMPNHKIELNGGIYLRNISNLEYRHDHPYHQIPAYTNSIWTLDNDVIMNKAAYIQLSYSPTERLRFICGLRAEQIPGYKFQFKYAFDTIPSSINHFKFTIDSYEYEHDKIELIPRFAALFRINDRNMLKFLYGKAIKNPSFEAITDTKTVDFNVGPEYIETFEINYNTSPLEWISLNSSLFMNKMNDLITREFYYNDIQQQGYSVLANEGRLNSKGIEIVLDMKPGSKFNCELSATYQKTSDKQTGNIKDKPQYSPCNLAYIKAAYKINQKINISVTGNFVDRMYTLWLFDVNGTNKGEKYRAGRSSPSWFNMGANIHFENIFDQKIYCNLRINNLLNTEQYNPTTMASNWANLGTLRPGRTFMLTAGWNF